MKTLGGLLGATFRALRVAMALQTGLTDHIWTIEELLSKIAG